MPETKQQLIESKTELEKELASPTVTQDSKALSRIGKELQRIDSLLVLMNDVETLQRELKDFEEILAGEDTELKEIVLSEKEQKEVLLAEKENALTLARTPRDPQDARDVIIEIRAGAGGDEAGLFAAELYRMYVQYAESKSWKVQLASTSRTGIGGYKEVIFEIHGDDVYRELKFESGVHRVQRVPETEKSGRVHTSTATVAVIPIVEEKDIPINPEDIKIETTTATGNGGQSVNTTYSAIRATHIPSGIMVYCQNERSQKQNKEKALEILRSRVYAIEEEKKRQEQSDMRKGQIGTGDRSEKIRTYNFPQDRVTDHRIKENFHELSAIMDGAIGDIIDAMQNASQKVS